MERLQRALDGLKSEFIEAGEEYRRTKDKTLIIEINALTTAINVLEENVHGRRITVITDCL